MKSLVLAFGVLAAGVVGSAKAEDISKSTLGAMGFGDAVVMTDAEGMEVRGKGTYAGVFGTSGALHIAPWGGGAEAANGYEAGAHHRHGSSLAKGSSLSYAGNLSSHFGLTVNFGGGRASAFAR